MVVGGNCLKQIDHKLGFMGLSECTSHLVEYAANRGSRITQMTRIIGGVMVVGGNCGFIDLWDCGRNGELSEAGFIGFIGFIGLGVGNRSSLLQKSC